jgi:hypothetical protein
MGADAAAAASLSSPWRVDRLERFRSPATIKEGSGLAGRATLDRPFAAADGVSCHRDNGHTQRECGEIGASVFPSEGRMNSGRPRLLPLVTLRLCLRCRTCHLPAYVSGVHGQHVRRDMLAEVQSPGLTFSHEPIC